MQRLAPLCCFAFLVALAGCSKPSGTGSRTIMEAKVPVSVSGHTAGVVQNQSPIRVEFINPVVPPEQVGVPLDKAPWTISPPVEGVTVWTSRNVLELRPASPLKNGEAYAVTLPLAGIIGDSTDTLEFGFAVQPQSFHVDVEGLKVQDKSGHAFEARGIIITADAAQVQDVESMLDAQFDGKPIKVEWTHKPDHVRHAFLIKDMARMQAARKLTLAWSGEKLNVDSKDSVTLDIPSLQVFTMIGARFVDADQQYIEARFSDPLDTKQDLDGLVRIDGSSPRFSKDGSVLRIYTADRAGSTAQLSVEQGVRSIHGKTLDAAFKVTVTIPSGQPQVRFASKGVIVPTSEGLTIPVEGFNVRSVVVEAIRIRAQNIPQFLQVNDFEESNELHRVGRVVWRQVVDLGSGEDKRGRWVRYGLNVSQLAARNKGGLYRLRLSLRPADVFHHCTNMPSGPTQLPPLTDGDAPDQREKSLWDSYEKNSGVSSWDLSQHKNDPCHLGYYVHNANANAVRTILVSDIGLIAKTGTDRNLQVTVTDLRTALPIPNAEVEILDYQQQPIASGTTVDNGTVQLKPDQRPFLVIARHKEQVGYLKMQDGAALTVSHFDVSGTPVTKGIKGMLYGERGVWRPGDDIFLTFVLFDPDHNIPADHPVRFELRDSQGRQVDEQTRQAGINGFYAFQTKTGSDAPTGNYTAKVQVGGTSFEETIRVETVRPNRLKIDLDFDKPVLTAGQDNAIKLHASWLHGAPARLLRADVRVSIDKGRTRFPGYPEYEFEDPTRRYQSDNAELFDDLLSETGDATIRRSIHVSDRAPGMVTATFSTRVFESSGSYSTDNRSVPLSPYRRYIGIRPPKGDAARGMLLTDTPQKVQLVAVDPEGKPVKEDVNVSVTLYKINWRWWWEKGEDTSLANYVHKSSHTPLASANVKLSRGEGSWEFQIKHPDWGRYLIMVEDEQGGHRASKVVYVDWPGWAGRAQKDQPGGASVLGFAADKSEYSVGNHVTLTIPAADKSRALISIESGSRVIQSDWAEPSNGEIRYRFKATEEMAPNVYVNVSVVQPHLQTRNDLPIRQYGIIPIKITNPETRLTPEVICADVVQPQTKAKIKVRDKGGQAMTYTLAVVDEGLLSLTRYNPPDLWSHFYRREALGVRTWDLYDQVAGAYGASLERMLAIGGGDYDEEYAQEVVVPQAGEKVDRFPPLVRFLGPFALSSGKTAEHVIDVPLYVGAVRVMVVAGNERAFGSSQKRVVVRNPLMVLGTLPRVLGADEVVHMPVTVFALDEAVKNVTVRVNVKGPITMDGSPTQTLQFSTPGDRTLAFPLKVTAGTGSAAIEITAEGGGHKGADTINIPIRIPNMPVRDVVSSLVAAGGNWKSDVQLPGMPGTHALVVEVSRLPPLDMAKRLEGLIQYPHGCVEQTTSSVFPQLYVNTLMDLTREQKATVEKNVRAGVERLLLFQTASGGFAYWPGGTQADPWGSSYAGHFLLEAKKAGYPVRDVVLDQWKRHQKNRTSEFRETQGGWTAADALLDQAYRVYTLALAGEADLGAMNRLRESAQIPVATRWRLAAAYHLAGKPEVAKQLTERLSVDLPRYRALSHTYGSTLRDQAMILETLGLMKDGARLPPVMKSVSEALASNAWLSTQETAYALLNMAQVSASARSEAPARFSYAWNGEAAQKVDSKAPVFQGFVNVGSVDQGTLQLDNSGEMPLHVRLIASGTPAVGDETDASSGLTLQVSYRTTNNRDLDVEKVEQGTDFIAEVTVRNMGDHLDNVALSHLVAAGWEISNARVEGGNAPSQSEYIFQDIRDDRVYTYFDLPAHSSKTFRVPLHAAYVGRFYAPMVSTEVMYDATTHARVRGQWVEVVVPGTQVAGR